MDTYKLLKMMRNRVRWDRIIVRVLVWMWVCVCVTEREREKEMLVRMDEVGKK